jgi:hypothetical protein
MTKDRTIVGFVAVGLLAVATTVATMRPHHHSDTGAVLPAGFVSFKEIKADVNKLPIEEFDDNSMVYSAKR